MIFSSEMIHTRLNSDGSVTLLAITEGGEVFEESDCVFGCDNIVKEGIKFVDKVNGELLKCS